VTDPRFDAVIETALGRIVTAVSNAIDKVSSQLGVLALSASSNAQRQALMSAERDLQLKSAQIRAAFARQIKAQVDKNVSLATAGASPSFALDTDWTSLSLVDNAEVERSVTADRLAQSLSQECEHELASMQAYLASLQPDSNLDRNPLRPQSVAKILLGTLAELGSAEEVIQTLSQQLARVLGPELASSYGQIVCDMRTQGIKPQSLSIQRARASGTSGAPTTGAGLPRDFHPTQPGAFPDSAGARFAPSGQMPSGFASSLQGQHAGPATAEAHLRAASALSEMFGVPLPTRPMEGPTPMGLRAPATPGVLPAANPDFQHLLRQIALQAPPTNWASDFPGTQGMDGLPGASADGSTQVSADQAVGFGGPLMAVNLIRAHRDELVRASGGAAIDQMVIDIVAALFDQVLSDPKVSPQMARQIARLQMPVLRVALGDMGFFNSRRHPVRRFVNRIASLSASFEGYEDGAGRACLERITTLVNDIVDGDFDRMDLYEAKLAELEAFVEAENAKEAAESAAVAALLNSKEADLRVQQRYMQILKRELADVDLPDFVRDFLAQVWSQVQVMASARDGAQAPIALRMRKAGHDLASSVQPKGSPQLRKEFLMKLPQLMKDLNEGLALIQWPEEAKQAFFSQLLPAHAESLKAPPEHDLTVRMREQRLTKVEQIAIPSREEAANDPLPSNLEDLKSPPVLTVVSALTQTEMQEAGFVPEAAVTAEGPLDIDLGTPADQDPSLAEVDINLDTPPTPAAGLPLLQHLQKGAAYQMMMQGQWKKVRLTWVSEGRTFFIFTQGHTHKQTISLTARTLAKMCDSGRFKAFEQAELIERATMRARRQLAALGSGTRDRSAA
jgi:hypothetical protein